ncbi:MAG: isoprenylcysteine carboxylmethyltransferase family protein [Chloroflexi bacterium]|nr:isoprenylcysteine carboxylmethyltransferase family protein [Chloroflexota bacterium]
MANQSRGPDPVRLSLIAAPPVIFGLPFGGGVFLHVMTGGDIKTGDNLVAIVLGVVLVAAGLFLAMWTLFTFRRSGEHPDPGHPTEALVTDGPFRYSRNPIYLGFTSLGLGIGLALNSYWVLGSVPVAFLALQFLVVTREERYLETVIGREYAEYRARVRRWL